MFEIKFDHNDNIVLVNASGVIILEDILELVQEIASRFSHVKKLYILIDFNNAQIEFDLPFLYLSLKEIEDRINELKFNVSKIYVAHASIESSTNSAIIKIFSSFFPRQSHYATERFCNRSEALEWLFHKQRLTPA